MTRSNPSSGPSARRAGRAAWAALALALIASLLGCRSLRGGPGGDLAGEPPLTAEQRALNEASFDHIWTTIRDKHWDASLGGLDWEAVRDELRPRVAAATTMREARGVMREMIGRLGQSHFQVYPAHLYEDVRGGDAGGPGSSGMHVRVIAGRALVVALDPDAPAAAAGVRPGWEILAVAGEKVGPRLAELTRQLEGKTYLDYTLAQSVEGRLRGEVGETIEVRFLDEQDRKRTLAIELAPHRGRKATLGNLPPQWVWFESRRIEGDIGYIAFSLFLDPVRVMQGFNDAMQSYGDADGIILDLRGNGGGIGAMAMGMAGWFVDEKGHRLGTMYTREGELNFAVNPRPGAYRGPVAVLVDGLSASTTEILAGGLQDLDRARIFGTPTAGAALPSMIERLPNGDGFQYAVANYVSQGGQSLEGHGVVPDVRVEPTRAALLEIGDPILTAAVAWIRQAG